MNVDCPGQYYDSETRLHYNWHRYYDPETGRYLTPNPIGLAGGINPFVYSLNDPVNLVDPDGLAPQLYTNEEIINQSSGIDWDLAYGIRDAFLWGIAFQAASVLMGLPPSSSFGKSKTCSQSYATEADTKQLGFANHIQRPSCAF